MALSLPSRRTVLKVSVASGLLALGAGSALALRKTALRTPTPELQALSTEIYAVLAALAERLCPADGPGAPGAEALGTARFLDGMLADAPDALRQQVVSALAIFENALTGALFGERVTPFTQLDPAQQDEVLASFRDSQVGFRRTLFRALTGLVLAFYWGDPRTWERIGYRDERTTEKLREAYPDNLIDLDALRATPLAQGT